MNAAVAEESHRPSLVLPEGRIHVWNIELEGVVAERADGTDLESLLSHDERLRADRFRFPEHRRAFVRSHGILRLLLGRYAGCPATALEFLNGDHGKPKLAQFPWLEFNLSHTKKAAVVAMSNSLPVGIDIEEVDPDFPHLEIAEQQFSPGEQAWLESLPENARSRAFCRLWCARESVLKAIGTGLSTPLQSVSIDLARKQAVVRQEGTGGGAPREFALEELHLHPTRTAFVAHDRAGGPHEIRTRDFSE